MSLRDPPVCQLECWFTDMYYMCGFLPRSESILHACRASTLSVEYSPCDLYSLLFIILWVSFSFYRGSFDVSFSAKACGFVL